MELSHFGLLPLYYRPMTIKRLDYIMFLLKLCHQTGGVPKNETTAYFRRTIKASMLGVGGIVEVRLKGGLKRLWCNLALVWYGISWAGSVGKAVQSVVEVHDHHLMAPLLRWSTYIMPVLAPARWRVVSIPSHLPASQPPRDRKF